MLGDLTLGGDGAGDFPARRGCHRPRSSGILYPKRLGRLPPLDGDTRTCTTEPEETKHPVLQRRYLNTERSSVRGWQDLRAMRDSRGPCSEKCPFLARSSRGVSSNSDLRGISDAWRAYLAKASSFWIHGGNMLPRTGDFPVRGRFRDAWSEKLATDCRPGTHFASIFPSASARERTVAESCHGLTLGDAPREYIATASQAKSALGRSPVTVGRWETHFASILPTERHLRVGGPIALP